MGDNRLDKAWNSRRGEGAIDTVMRFSQEGLVFGAGTLLAKSRGGDRNLAIDPLDARLHALLAAAHLRRPPALALAHLRKAAECWSEGDDALAAMHLTLSGLDKLAAPEADAHRLFLADGLLKSGVEAAAVIGAIEAGGTALDGLRKFDPDQPRVPAGSGRTSGEWTSGDNSSSSASSPVGTAQSLTSRPIVNPDTITPVVGSISACDEASDDCIRAAEYAARNDAANDNAPRFLDETHCMEATAACDVLSWSVEDIPFLAETGQGGGVFFPHGGVVLVNKGQLDRYYPPLPGGRRPSFKRSAEPGAEPDRGEMLRVGSYTWPPWNVAPGETVERSPVGFSACSKVIGILAARMNGRITERTCSLSEQWGKVIRAKIAHTTNGSPGVALVTCVKGSGPGIGVAIKLDDC